MKDAVESIAGQADLIACPGEVGIVNIAFELERARRVPRSTHIDAMLVLDRTALAEGIGMVGRVLLVIVTVQQHQGPLVCQATTE